MLNLLFISDSPKAEFIKSALQPVLKVIIDVVTDFDHGLKDVFEKRPATVCIQDHIGGVTGESVARHIQMLLGNSAPTFILLFSGNEKPRAIKGLYEHIIDLKQSNEAVADELKNTLKTLLGDQWERVYIPPKQKSGSGRATVSVPEESRVDADRLVDDFLSDLEASGFSVVDDHPPVVSAGRKVAKTKAPQTEARQESGQSPGTVESERAQAINDDLAELLLMEAGRERRVEHPSAVSLPVIDEAEPVAAGAPEPALIAEMSPPAAAPESLAPTEMPSAKTPLTVPAVPSAGMGYMAASPAPVTPSFPPAAADFRINQTAPLDDEHIPEDLLLAFEENYRSESRIVRRIVVAAAVCGVIAAGGWYIVTQKPQVADSLRQKFLPSSGTKQVPAALPSAIPVPKPVPLPVPQPVAAPLLPAFIPKDGHDGSYAAKNPGWERYVGKNAEFRLFSASGRFQAVQVMAQKGVPLPESLLKTVLREFAGTHEYQVTTRTMKAGIRVETGRIPNKGEIVVYRKNGTVAAFVVSVN